MTSPASKSSSWINLLIILGFVVIVYGQTLNFRFINYDDDKLIYNNEQFLSGWKNIGTSFTSHAFVGAGGESIYYRPILLVSYIFDFHLWKLNPFGYHLTNILLHISTSLIVFFLMRRIAENKHSALFVALIFALHPIQTESVAWISGRNDTILGLFIVLMMYFYVRSEEEGNYKNRFFGLSIVSFSFAMFTKESAAFYLLLFPLYDICCQNKSLKQLISFRYVSKFWLIGLILILYLIIRVNIFGEVIGAEQLYGSNKPFFWRIGNVPAIVSEHLKLLVYPFNLSVAHPVSDLIWFQQPWNIIAILILFLLPGLIWLTWLKDKILCFGLSWIAIGLLPVMNIIPMAIPILEHRLYVPTIGFALVIVRVTEYLPTHLNIYRRITLTIINITFAILSIFRLPVWENGIKLFNDATEKAPRDISSYFSLARAHYNIQQYDETIAALKKIINLAPNDPRGYAFLREVYYVRGQYYEVLKICQQLIRIEPQNSQRYIEAGEIFEEMGMFDSAAAYYQKGIK